MYKHWGIQSFNHKWGEEELWKWFKGDFKFGMGCACVNTCVCIVRSPYVCYMRLGYQLRALGEHMFTLPAAGPECCRQFSFISALLSNGLDWEDKSHLENISGDRTLWLCRQSKSCLQGQWWAGVEVHQHRDPPPACCLAPALLG